MNQEIYKTIKDYPKYEVSNFGNVRHKLKQNIKTPIQNNDGYYQTKLWNREGRKNQLIHRLVAKAFIKNKSKKELVNHINGIRTDNNVSNLRWVNKHEALANSKIYSNNTSSVKGVSFDKTKKLFRSSIIKDGKNFHLGYFNTLEEAAKARQDKAIELFGEYINHCETEPRVIKIEIPKVIKQKTRIIIEFEPDEDYLALEKEFEELINK